MRKDLSQRLAFNEGARPAPAAPPASEAVKHAIDLLWAELEVYIVGRMSLSRAQANAIRARVSNEALRRVAPAAGPPP